MRIAELDAPQLPQLRARRNVARPRSDGRSTGPSARARRTCSKRSISAALGRSFRTANDRELVRFGESATRVCVTSVERRVGTPFRGRPRARRIKAHEGRWGTSRTSRRCRGKAAHVRVHARSAGARQGAGGLAPGTSRHGHRCALARPARGARARTGAPSPSETCFWHGCEPGPPPARRLPAGTGSCPIRGIELMNLRAQAARPHRASLHSARPRAGLRSRAGRAGGGDRVQAFGSRVERGRAGG